MKRIFELFVLIQIFLCSHSVTWNLWLTDRAAQILFLFSSFLLFYQRSTKNNTHSIQFKKNLWISGGVTVWVLLNVLLFNTDIVDMSYLIIITYSISMMFIISAYDFYEFREKVRKVLCFVLVVSIIVQVLRDFGILIPKALTTLNGEEFNFCLGLINTDWGYMFGMHKLSSIYGEPGQLQIVVFFILCLFIDELLLIDRWKINIKKFSVLLLGLIMTFSTMAYLMIGFLVAIICFKSNVLRKNKYLFPVYALIAGCGLYAIILSPIVQNKINGVDYEGNQNLSFEVRIADNLALLEMTKDNPIVGVGVETKTFSKLKFALGSKTDSNGWLRASAQLGIPYVLSLFFFIYAGIKKMRFRLQALYVLLLLIITQCNEPYYFCPYIYMFVYSYRTYKKI